MSSLDAPGDVGGEITKSGAAMLALTTVAVALRFVSRGVAKQGGYWWDDWLALAAWTFALTLYSIYFGMRNLGYGRHIGTIPPENIPKILLHFYVSNIIYNTGLTLVKLSALMFYVRVFSLRRMWFKVAVYTVSAMSIIWCVGITFAACFECSPIKKAWNPSLAGHCSPEYNLYMATAVPNIFVDFLILIMPFPFLKSLQISWKQRAALGLIFALGYCSMALSIVRTVEVTQFSPDQVTDPTWYLTVDILLVQVELGCGLISICLPAHAALVRYLTKHVFKLSFLSSQDTISIHGKDGLHVGAVGDPRDKKPREASTYNLISVASNHRSKAQKANFATPVGNTPNSSIGALRDIDVGDVA